MKGRANALINREGIQIRTDAKWEVEVPEQYVELCKAYWFSPIVLIIEKEEPKKDIVEEPIIKTNPVWKSKLKKWENVKKTGKKH